MLLKFDPTNLNIYVMTGPLEAYKPNKEIKQLYKEATEVKAKIDQFALNTWKTTNPKELEDIFSKEEQEREKFNTYIKEEYVPKVLAIRDKVTKINESLQKKSDKKGG